MVATHRIVSRPTDQPLTQVKDLTLVKPKGQSQPLGLRPPGQACPTCDGTRYITAWPPTPCPDCCRCTLCGGLINAPHAANVCICRNAPPVATDDDDDNEDFEGEALEEGDDFDDDDEDFDDEDDLDYLEDDDGVDEP